MGSELLILLHTEVEQSVISLEGDGKDYCIYMKNNKVKQKK